MGQTWPKFGKNGPKWPRMGKNVPKMTKNGQKWTKMAKIGRESRDPAAFYVDAGTHLDSSGRNLSGKYRYKLLDFAQIWPFLAHFGMILAVFVPFCPNLSHFWSIFAHFWLFWAHYPYFKMD